MKTSIKIALLILVTITVAGVGYGITSFKKEKIDQTPQVKMKEVVVEKISELDKKIDPLPLTGRVKSISEATIQAESQGRITNVYKKLGDYVSAGTIIAEIENSRERASLLQAEAGMDTARASIDISSVGNFRDIKLLDEARTSAINTLRNAYDSADDSIKTKIDTMFSNPKSETPKFNIISTNSQLVTTISNDRVKVEQILTNQSIRKNNLSESNNIEVEIEQTEEEIKFLKIFADNIVSALNQSISTFAVTQATIDLSKTNASLARASLSGTLSSLSSVKDLINTRTAQVNISQKQGDTGSLGSATIKQAEAILLLAKANYERTIIRAPISGTINSLDIEKGNTVSMLENIAVISNNNALEIETFITDEDKRTIALGSKALIEDTYQAIVTRIAPALDPKTKKVEVKLGLLSANGDLVNGQSVGIKIERINYVSRKTSTNLSIPLSALKIGVDKIVVFTVDENNILVEHEVKIGPLIGSKIFILDGINPDMEIVLDARGLKTGETVRIRVQ